jgi:ketosteroid isomerase-like protein
MGNPSTERAVQWLNDRIEIAELLTALARGLDSHDLPSIAASLASDCVWDVEPGAPPVAGRGAIVERLRGRFISQEDDRTNTQVSNLMIGLDGGDSASTDAYVFIWHSRGDGSVGLAWGRWRDTLVRTDVGWRVGAHRVYVAATENEDLAGYPLYGAPAGA